MTLQARIVQSGLSAVNAQAIVGTIANTLTAAGTVQGNAVALTADLNRFTTVAAGTGAIAPAMNPSDSIQIFNAGANALLVYPPVGGTINALALNAGYSVATATPFCELYCVNPTTYIARQSA